MTRKIIFILLILTATFIWGGTVPFAEAVSLPSIQLGMDDVEDPEKVSSALQILFLLTILTLAPSILILTTSFARIIIVLSFLRQAMGTQQTPPTQILIGLGLFLTLFVMGPTWNEINDKALQPFLNEEISQTDALKKAEMPLKTFMLKQTREKDLSLFIEISGENPTTNEEIDIRSLIPAFIISELKTAFQIGFLIYIPFLILDMVVASILLSMGMMMLPPVLISLPFKLMLFVMVDGWYLTVGSLMRSFGG
ncbi:flagellar type III secretion system pore protein FliP [Nitrospinaceae bacterium]|jgi:flagellar biosynthetic protein FliP|nr:flagellar type III secretion system pore protein FliP [Nitrospinaceae bacterium]MDC1121855.1 flagellar type III secretion system pore protein FliP [Nitrospinaceae bacterium]HCG73487.1 flagellar biosynthetic protein FliP [Nitrospina sp.]|tara:strand:- start:241 stop:999 length:759 start_codon:yes stop_codon:yes gene_type:complete